MEDALKRELREELCIEIDIEALEPLGTFYASAAGSENRYLQMDVFIVPVWRGEIAPAAEVEEVLWISSAPPEGIKLGSIFQHDVLPILKERGLIR